MCTQAHWSNDRKVNQVSQGNLIWSGHGLLGSGDFCWMSCFTYCNVDDLWEVSSDPVVRCGTRSQLCSDESERQVCSATWNMVISATGNLTKQNPHYCVDERLQILCLSFDSLCPVAFSGILFCTRGRSSSWCGHIFAGKEWSEWRKLCFISPLHPYL